MIVTHVDISAFYFAYFRSWDIPMDIIVHSFTSDSAYNDCIVRDFVYKVYVQIIVCGY